MNHKTVLVFATLLLWMVPESAHAGKRGATRQGSYARLGLGLGVGQDFVEAGARPIPSAAFVLAGGYFLFPKLALEVTAEGMWGRDFFGGDDTTLVQIGVSAGARVYVPQMGETVYAFGGIGGTASGRDPEDPRAGGGVIGGVGWEADPRTDTWGVTGTYALRIVGEPTGVAHGIHVVAYITFDYF